MGDQPNQDRVITIGDQEYTVVRSIAKLKVVTEDQVPAPILAQAKSNAQKVQWSTGSSPDLIHVQFVLDAEGANENWDYMPRPQLMNSHATATFKPIDMDHIVKEHSSMTEMDKSNPPPVRNTICGVMTNTALAHAATGKLLTDDEVTALDKTDDMNRKDGDKIGVVAWGALYKFLFPKTCAGLVDKINSGDMCVSMERWIARMDFLTWDENAKEFKATNKADADASGISTRWATHQAMADKPVYRRSLSFIYGGVANTATPAQKLSRFLAPIMPQASASTVQALNALQVSHDQLHQDFLLCQSTEDKQRIIGEHERLTRAIAGLLGDSSTK